jgi:hypothetical protein
MFKEFGKARLLMRVEARYKCSDILPEGRKVSVQLLDAIQRRPQDLLASIARIGFTTAAC